MRSPSAGTPGGSRFEYSRALWIAGCDLIRPLASSPKQMIALQRDAAGIYGNRTPLSLYSLENIAPVSASGKANIGTAAFRTSYKLGRGRICIDWTSSVPEILGVPRVRRYKRRTRRSDVPGETIKPTPEYFSSSLERSGDSARTAFNFASRICHLIPVAGGMSDVR